MNNYKKRPFVPAIQKTSTLVILSFISVLGFIISINSVTEDISPSYNEKVEAANLMKASMSMLKNYRMESGIFIDDENNMGRSRGHPIHRLKGHDEFVCNYWIPTY